MNIFFGWSDESGFHDLTLRAALTEWKHTTLPMKKEFKTMQSMREMKLMAFLDAQGILLLKFLDHSAIVKPDCYSINCNI